MKLQDEAFQNVLQLHKYFDAEGLTFSLRGLTIFRQLSIQGQYRGLSCA